MSGHVAEARGKAGHHGQNELEDKCKVEDGVATNKVNKEPSTAINEICARNQHKASNNHQIKLTVQLRCLGYWGYGAPRVLPVQFSLNRVEPRSELFIFFSTFDL